MGINGFDVYRKRERIYIRNIYVYYAYLCILCIYLFLYFIYVLSIYVNYYKLLFL